MITFVITFVIREIVTSTFNDDDDDDDEEKNDDLSLVDVNFSQFDNVND